MIGQQHRGINKRGWIAGGQETLPYPHTKCVFSGIADLDRLSSGKVLPPGWATEVHSNLQTKWTANRLIVSLCDP